jgi:predicted nucleotidyltransferase
MERRVRGEIVAALAGFPVIGAFIYGSVARGTANAMSDVDVLVIVGAAPPPAQTAELRSTFVELQRSHGYQPDPDYPVELFTVNEVRAAIATEAPDEDQREVLRALRGPKDILIDSEHLQQLIAAAGATG